MKLLYTCGDSWTAGEEIPNKFKCQTENYYNTWPWFFCQNFKIPLCINEGHGGASNDYIFRKTNNFILDWIGKSKPVKDLIIIVGWTSHERTEIPSNNNYYHITSNDIIGPSPKKHHVEYRDSFYRIYDDELFLLKQIRHMLILKNLCKGLGIKYYDFVAIGKPVFELQRLSKLHFKQELNSTCNTSWRDYIRNNKHPVYRYGHPTIVSHKYWADELTRNIQL